MLHQKHVSIEEFSDAMKHLELQDNLQESELNDNKVGFLLRNVSLVNPKRVIREFDTKDSILEERVFSMQRLVTSVVLHLDDIMKHDDVQISEENKELRMRAML